MKFFAKLIALMVVLTFAAAIYFQVEGVVQNVDKPEKDKKVETQQEVESFQLANVSLPDQYESEVSKLEGMQVVKAASLEELKKRIYLEQEVLVYVDNSHLRNPFLGVNDKLLVSLTGFDGEHLVSSGREIAQNRFIYLAEDFFKAWQQSGSKAWIIK